MKPEEINAAIAEACGWRFAPANGPLDLPWRKPNTPAWEDNKGWIGRASNVPSYYSDLNAMHEAEKTLTVREYWEYADLVLKEVVWKSGPPGKAYQCATAPQRCEAFLRVKGRWIE